MLCPQTMYCCIEQFCLGILVIGGMTSPRSVEFWWEVPPHPHPDPEQANCLLGDYGRDLNQGATVDFVSGHLVACYSESCEIYREGAWQHLQNTLEMRLYHSSATTEDSVLLIGGYSGTGSTEWIPVDGSPSQAGPFHVRHGIGHCTIQLSTNTIVVTGGQGDGGSTLDYVTEYQLTTGQETLLQPLQQPRYGHACGVYQGVGGEQVNKMKFAAKFSIFNCFSFRCQSTPENYDRA